MLCRSISALLTADRHSTSCSGSCDVPLPAGTQAPLTECACRSVPATGFGAQAFLFTSALAGSVSRSAYFAPEAHFPLHRDSARSSRLIAMGLSILLSVMTLQLFTRCARSFRVIRSVLSMSFADNSRSAPSSRRPSRQLTPELIGGGCR